VQGSAADPDGRQAAAPEGDGEGAEYSFTNLGGGLGRGGAPRGLSPDEASSFEVLRARSPCCSACVGDANLLSAKKRLLG